MTFRPFVKRPDIAAFVAQWVVTMAGPAGGHAVGIVNSDSVCVQATVWRTNIANAQALPTYPLCHYTFRARIGLVGNLRTQCTNSPTIQNSAPTSVNPPSDSLPLTPGINSISPTIMETTSQCSAHVTPTITTTTATSTTT
ncbi:unnamed protein product [Schistocephalus solidus]|uniref:SCP domain-containing protein n=1 Tax=Schistocephalus solidus TaxID=70667 RepID=A0A183S9W4_SCHSO|nr:unnamed protein product [Schistocephalus solidus]